jgi:cation transporter-like permease
MILLPVFLWLIVWAILSVVICALLGLPPGTKMLETAAIIFVCGGILLPLVGWLLLKFARRRQLQQD